MGRTASAVYFSAGDGGHGRELWQLPLLADVVFADGFHLVHDAAAGWEQTRVV